MGAVAVALQERGFKVTGSDENVYPPMSSFLQEKGIAPMEGYCAANIPSDADVVVIGNAMRRGNPEVEAVLNRKLLYLSLPEVLRNFFLRGRPIWWSPVPTVKRPRQRCFPGSWRKPDANQVT